MRAEIIWLPIHNLSLSGSKRNSEFRISVVGVDLFPLCKILRSIKVKWQQQMRSKNEPVSNRSKV